jgi:hypothetical protein
VIQHGVFLTVRSDGTVYFAGSQALCANLGFSDSSVIIDPDGLDISIPLSSRMSVRVGYIVSGNLTFSANFTFSRHLPHLLSYIVKSERVIHS